MQSAGREFHLVKRLAFVILLGQFPAMAQQATLSLSSGSGVPGGSATLNLSMATSGGAQPAGVQWTLTYSPSDISAISFAPGAASSAAGKSISCAGTSGSTICIDYGLNSNVIADGVLGIATFTLAGGAVDSSAPIQMSGVVVSTLAGTAIPGSGTGSTISISQTVLPVVSGLSCNPASVNAPGSAACTVTLSSAAPVGGFVVALASNNLAVTVPATATVLVGASTIGFTATVGTAGTSQVVLLTGSSGGTSQSFSLNIVAPPRTISGNTSALGSGATMTLSGSASATALADGSGNYTFSNLFSGTYTVTPSKAGYVFLPANLVVAITTANQTAVNFTAAVMVLSANPSAGAGVFPTFTLTVTDPSSAANINSVGALFTASGGSTSSACYVVYNRANATVELYSDDGTSFTGKGLGSSANLQNSQCAVGYTAVSVSGNSLLFTLQVLYKTAFFGVKNMYLLGTEFAGMSSGWASVGSWTAGTGIPTAVSANPSSGSGVFPTYTLTVSDPTSAANISSVGALVTAGAASNTAAACYMVYTPANATVSLYGDDGVSISSKGLGSSANLQNSQCAIGYAAASISGDSVLFTVQVLYKTSFFGAKNLYLMANEPGGLSSGWVNVGSWTTGYANPAAVSASPPSGAGIFPTYTLTVSDPSSAANINSVGTLVTAGATSNLASTCDILYNRASATVELFGDDGVSISSKALGSSANLQNSQCAVGYTGATVSGNSVVFTLQVLYKTSFFGAKTLYLDASDIGSSSGWVSVGTWTAGSGLPTADSASPSSGTGVFPTYTLTVSDPTSAASIASVTVLVTSGAATNTTSACYMVYNPANATIGLYGDDGVTFLSKPAGSSANLQNTQCAVGYAGSTVSGNSVVLTLQVLYKSVFSGVKTLYLEASETSASSGLVNVGSWTP